MGLVPLPRGLLLPLHQRGNSKPLTPSSLLPFGLMLLADTTIAELPFLNARDRKALSAGGINTVADILRIAPRRYEDRRRSAPLISLANGESACLQLRIYSASWRFSYTRFYELVAGSIEESSKDAGARILLRWYNMPYIAKILATGMELSVYGKVRVMSGHWVMCNPDFEVLEEEDTGLRLAAAALGEPTLSTPHRAATSAQKIHTDRIVPIYRSIPGVSPRSFRSIVWKTLAEVDWEHTVWEDFDPAPTYPMFQVLRDLHFPQDEQTAHKARLRLALSECFARQFRVAWRRRRSHLTPGRVTCTTDFYCRELLDSLPFHLTLAQQRCLAEIRRDMSSPASMNRLLQGDVGSGKTLVALCAMLMCVESGMTAALLAPTQILAEQHYRNFRRLLHHTDVRLSLRTSDHADDSHLASYDARIAEDPTPRIIIGTHTLLYDKNRPQNLGLAVIDEQHKFGVAQRERFIRTGTNPDVLVMTATPIPRTLTLTLYGDLDVSTIDELPPGRGEIITALRNPQKMERIYDFLRSEISAGHQAYIIAPLIQQSEASERSAATEEIKHWREILPEFSIGLMHGKMSAVEKEETMTNFAAGRTQVLISTTVVEVGVDVPNATVMIINNADSFGLSQLHQLRGRIGRGSLKSWCILLSSAKAGDPAREKLNILCRTTNGFEIAEEDFRLRGPGDVLGTAQSGLADVRFPEWLVDTRLIHRATLLANSILDDDPDLSAPTHAALRRRMLEETSASITG